MNIFSRLLTAATIAMLTLAIQPAATLAVDVSANMGLNSRYVYRGVPQEKWSVNGGVDVDASGFYLGTWFADVSPGLEADIYGGFTGEAGAFSYGVGFTGYFYTDDFDDTYLEVNLSAGWNILTLDLAIGEYENFADPTLDYTFASAKLEQDGFYALVGAFGRDFDGEYFELGYGNTFSRDNTDIFDYSLLVIRSSKELAGVDAAGQPQADTFVNFTLSRNFGF